MSVLLQFCASGIRLQCCSLLLIRHSVSSHLPSVLDLTLTVESQAATCDITTPLTNHPEDVPLTCITLQTQDVVLVFVQGILVRLITQSAAKH